MADDDLPTRLHWPADPLNPGVRARPAAAPPASAESGDGIAQLRREMAELRHAMDDLADRVEMRQMRAAVDDLRTEIISLRRVVLEWPELDTLTSELSALRSQLVDGATAERPTPAELGPIAGELASLREEIASLRRRIALRGRVDDTALDAAQIEQVADEVADRLRGSKASSTSRRRR